MQAVVTASNDPTLVTAVSEGNATETQSIKDQGGSDDSSEVVDDANDNDTTPESPASQN